LTSPARFSSLFQRLPAWLAVALVAGLSGCVGPHVIVQPDDRPGMPARVFSPKPVVTQHGKASFYWEDARTATGERFHADSLSAAHRTFPLNSWVKVTNELNGRTVVVRINDRGPFVRGRIIDLSRGAARQVDMLSEGIVPVRVDLLREIEVVQKPNIELTPEIRRQALERMQARIAAQKKPSQKPQGIPAPTPVPVPASSETTTVSHHQATTMQHHHTGTTTKHHHSGTTTQHHHSTVTTHHHSTTTTATTHHRRKHSQSSSD
jgi:rare lipoprotein A